MKNEMYLIIDRDRKDGCILARVIDSILKCGFHKRFFDSMDEIVRYLKSHDTDDRRKYIVYEEHWL